MFQLFGSKPLPIGLDVGCESVKILQLTHSPSTGLAVAAAVRALIPDDIKSDPDQRVAFAGQTLRAALRSRRFRGKRIVAALPKDVVHYKTHRLPPMPAAELMMAARIDARDLFRFDPDSADVQCLDAGELMQGGERRHEVTLVAAGKKYVDNFVRTIDRAGGRIASLEVEPSAIRRAAARVGGSAGDAPPRLLLDIGASQSRLLICQGSCARVFKAIDVGAEHLRTAVSRKLGLPPAEAEQLRRRAAGANGKPPDGVRQGVFDASRHAVETIAREALACVRYHAVTFRGPAPHRVELVGGVADDAQVCAVLAETLAMPAGPLDLFHGIDVGNIGSADRTSSLGEWAVVLGLALKGANVPTVTIAAGVSSDSLAIARCSPRVGALAPADAAIPVAAGATMGVANE